MNGRSRHITNNGVAFIILQIRSGLVTLVDFLKGGSEETKVERGIFAKSAIGISDSIGEELEESDKGIDKLESKKGTRFRTWGGESKIECGSKEEKGSKESGRWATGGKRWGKKMLEWGEKEWEDEMKGNKFHEKEHL